MNTLRAARPGYPDASLLEIQQYSLEGVGCCLSPPQWTAGRRSKNQAEGAVQMLGSRTACPPPWKEVPCGHMQPRVVALVGRCVQLARWPATPLRASCDCGYTWLLKANGLRQNLEPVVSQWPPIQGWRRCK